MNKHKNNNYSNNLFFLIPQIRGREGRKKELTERFAFLVLLSPKECGTLTESWPTSGIVALRVFFIAVIDSFVIYT